MSPDDEFHNGEPAGRDSREDTAETRDDVSFGDVFAAAPASDAGGQGAVWGPLEILEESAQGTFGGVFRAGDPALRHEVALKRFQIPPGPPPAKAAALVREGQMLARIRHENVVTVHGAFEAQGEVGIWMDFVRGRTL